MNVVILTSSFGRSKVEVSCIILSCMYCRAMLEDWESKPVWDSNLDALDIRYNDIHN